MKLRLVLSLVTLLVFSACMDATITQEYSEDVSDDRVVTTTQPKMDDIGIVFDTVSEQPVLQDGMSALYGKIQYPRIARKAHVEGRVFLSFVVDKNGDVRDAEVVRGIGAGCDEEALRVIRLAKFKPGRKDGEPVNTKMAMAVMFKLR